MKRHYEFKDLSEKARRTAYRDYEDKRALDAYDKEIPEIVDGMRLFMRSINEHSALPCFGGVYLRCGFQPAEYDYIDFERRANGHSSNWAEWELANEFNSLMDENMGIFLMASKVVEMCDEYYDYCDDHDAFDVYHESNVSDVWERAEKLVEDTYDKVLERVALKMEWFPDHLDGVYFSYDDGGYFDEVDGPGHMYHEDGTRMMVWEARK